MEKRNILNISIHSISLNELLENLSQGVVFTPNVDDIVKLQKDRTFYKSFQQADWVVCDSNILNLASKFLNEPIKETIPGSSLLPAFCDYHKDNHDTTVFLLGAAEGVAKQAAEMINTRIGREIVIGAHSPSFGFEKNEAECLEIVELINQSKANVLVVGVGSPKQQNWIIKYKKLFTHAKIFMALGATIDFEAGNKKRAPSFYQKFYIEWYYRLLQEPKRLWKRYLIDDVPFFWLIMKQKLGTYKNPFRNESVTT